MALLQATGKLSLLRVHDVGTKFGPPSDQIDVEVVFRIQNDDRSFGFQLRADGNRVARHGMLDLLRDAFNNNWTVTTDFDIDTGKTVWQFQTGSGVNAQPVTFTRDGKQYVTILSGVGGLWWNAARQQLRNVPQGGSVWTFALID